MAKALIEFTTEQKRVIKDQFFPQGTTDVEMIFNMQVAKDLGLNPILKEIYFVQRRLKVDEQWVTKIEPLVGRDAFLKLAHSSGKFAGIETTTEIKPTPIFKNGAWTTEDDLVAICKVYRTDTERPFIVEVGFKEYAQHSRSGDLTKFWREKSETMLKKVAESQCLRKAFNISGAYSEEEMQIDVEPKSEEVVKQVTETTQINKDLTADLMGKNINIATGKVIGTNIETITEEAIEAGLEEEAQRQNTLELEV